MEELANTLAAIVSGAWSLSMCISNFTEACDHSCILRDRGRPESALLLQLSNVLMAESKRCKDSNIVTSKRPINQAHHCIGLLQSSDICHLGTISDWFAHGFLPMNDGPRSVI
jgi:hypothetical protein